MDNNDFIEKFYNPEDEANAGFEEMVYKRQSHKNTLTKRLKKYLLSEEEIDRLLKIVEKAEIEIEKIKRGLDYKKADHADMIQMMKKIYYIQQKMKDDFEKKLTETVKNKYEKAKKELEKRNKNK